jgi:hypothetical protein
MYVAIAAWELIWGLIFGETANTAATKSSLENE